MSSINDETPPLGAAGLGDDAFPGGNCTSKITPKAHVTQAKIELLFDDIGCNIGGFIATLNAAVAMRDAGDSVGVIYALRRGRAYWKAISLSAAELVAVDAERLSALRQGEASP
jgi:hypothetical protein